METIRIPAISYLSAAVGVGQKVNLLESNAVIAGVSWKEERLMTGWWPVRLDMVLQLLTFKLVKLSNPLFDRVKDDSNS
jgi:hypothetical protein